MTSENITLLKRGYEAFNRRDVDAMLEFLDPEVVTVDSPEAPDRSVYRQHEGFLANIESVQQIFEGWHLEPLSFVENGEKLLVEVRQSARGKGSGLEVEDHLLHVWTIRDGKALRLEAYRDADEARRAAGLDS